MEISADVYEYVFELARELAESQCAWDTGRYWTLYNELKAYVVQQESQDYSHPFLYETLADFTLDDRIAEGLYLTGLSVAERNQATEYCVSIRFALAKLNMNLGNRARAYAYAESANELGKTLDDLELRCEISEFLLNEAKT